MFDLGTFDGIGLEEAGSAPVVTGPEVHPAGAAAVLFLAQARILHEVTSEGVAAMGLVGRAISRSPVPPMEGTGAVAFVALSKIKSTFTSRGEADLGLRGTGMKHADLGSSGQASCLFEARAHTVANETVEFTGEASVGLIGQARGRGTMASSSLGGTDFLAIPKGRALLGAPSVGSVVLEASSIGLATLASEGQSSAIFYALSNQRQQVNPSPGLPLGFIITPS